MYSYMINHMENQFSLLALRLNNFLGNRNDKSVIQIKLCNNTSTKSNLKRSFHDLCNNIMIPGIHKLNLCMVHSFQDMGY